MKQTSNVRVKITGFSHKKKRKVLESEIDMPHCAADDMIFEMINSGITGADAFSGCLQEFHFPISEKTLRFIQEEFQSLALANYLSAHFESNDDLQGAVAIYFPNAASM
ncbi:hypothetical protein [Ruegeria sp. SCP11]|uniref:hypothetical protein n=1 Tax=Ruegeria sp. SCP11 TaxID=3141378 RepID=UPI00333A7E1A